MTKVIGTAVMKGMLVMCLRRGSGTEENVGSGDGDTIGSALWRQLKVERAQEEH